MKSISVLISPIFGRTYNKIYVNNYGGLQFAISENNLFPPLTPTANGVPVPV